LWLLWLQLKRNITLLVIKIHPFWNNLRRVNTLCTISLSTENSIRCLRVYLCRLCDSHNNSDYFLNKITWFVFVTQTQSINCEPEIHLSSRNAKVGSCDCHALFPSCLLPYIKFWTVWSIFTDLVWRWSYWRSPKYNTFFINNTANTDLWMRNDTTCA